MRRTLRTALAAGLVPLAAAAHPLTPRAEGDAAQAVTGTVRYVGTPFAAERVDIGNDPFCSGARAAGTLMSRPVAAGPDGGLADVVVYVSDGAPADGGPEPSGTPVLDQQGCAYVPSVLAVRAGQEIVIRNSDQTMHNVHVRPERSRGFNIGQPLAGVEARRTFAVPEVGIHVSCDIHGWMHASIAVFDHPYFAVTGADGTFALPELPPGDYVVEAWHRSLGVVARSVTVGADGDARVELVFGR